MELFAVVLVSVIICGPLGYAISKNGLGTLLGVLLGPLGVLIACFIKKG